MAGLEAALFGAVVATGLVWVKTRVEKRKLVRAPDEAALERKVAALCNARVGSPVDSLQLILDFDRTMTTFHFAPGVKGASCHGIVEHLWDGSLKAQAEAYNAFYYPIEVDASRTVDEKVPFMEDWYAKVNALIVQSGLTRGQLVEQVASAPVRLRPGLTRLLDWADAHGVPVTVFSAGITNVAEEVLRQKWRSPLPPLLRVVSNEMLFDATSGVITGFKAPLLHMFNKVAATAEEVSPDWMAIMRGRPNVLLVGDGLGDAAMADGLHPGVKSAPRAERGVDEASASASVSGAPSLLDMSGGLREGAFDLAVGAVLASRAEQHVLRVGLCNVNVQALGGRYEEVYDLVICDDGPLDEVISIIRKVEEAAAEGSGRAAVAVDTASLAA